MTKWKFLLPMVALAMFVSVGCSSDEPVSEEGDGVDITVNEVSAEKYCLSCGQVAGTDSCCDESATKCEKCGFAEGSPLCCTGITPSEGDKLCASCGQVAGTDLCCAEGAAICEKCGLHEGSPLCCKLPAKDAAE